MNQDNLSTEQFSTLYESALDHFFNDEEAEGVACFMQIAEAGGFPLIHDIFASSAFDHPEVFSLIARLADEGDASAKFELGRFYNSDGPWGRDEQRAMALIREAAELGFEQAQLVLARWLLEPDFEGRSEEEAASWFSRLASVGYSPAFYPLSRMYAEGRGVKADPDAADRLLRLAADQHDPHAMHDLGLLLFRGYYGEQDKLRALQLLNGSSAADLPIPEDVAFELARMADEGIGMERDEHVAVKFYFRALPDERAAARLRQLEAEGNEDVIFEREVFDIDF